ncbi:MAG: lamin tail domain-containing protein [Parcubacteria group bacterium]
MNNKLTLSILLVLSVGLTTQLGVPRLARAQTAPPAGPIVITEVLPNAVNENSGELVELINSDEDSIDLTGYQFVDAAGVVQSLVGYTGTVPFGVLQMSLAPDQVALVLDKDYAGEYNAAIAALDTSDQIVLLATSTGNLSLANSNDSVLIRQPGGAASDSVAWSNDPGSEVSLSREFTPDGQLTEIAPATSLSLGYVPEQAAPPSKPALVLSELLPNPESGEEFIELQATGSQTVDLSQVSLADASGREITLSGTLGPGEFTVLYKSSTGLSLNNDGDKITLRWLVDNSMLDETSYATAPAGQSWARFSKAFSWTMTLTPGEPNVLKIEEPDEPTQDSEENVDNDEDNQTDELDESDALPQEVANLGELTDLESKTLVRVKGVVAAKTGTFYKNILHLVDSKAGIVVKTSNEESPGVGTQIEVSGAVDRYAGLVRVTADSIAPIKNGSTLEALTVAPGKLADEHLGRLIKMTGTVTKRSGKSFRIAAATKAGVTAVSDQLISVRSGSGITTSAPKKGSTVSVTGIVLESSGKLVLAPRASSDITGPGSNPETKELLKTGSAMGTILTWSGGVALVLSSGWRVVREGLRRAGRSGRSRSSRGHGDR